MEIAKKILAHTTDPDRVRALACRLDVADADLIATVVAQPTAERVSAVLDIGDCQDLLTDLVNTRAARALTPCLLGLAPGEALVTDGCEPSHNPEERWDPRRDAWAFRDREGDLYLCAYQATAGGYVADTDMPAVASELASSLLDYDCSGVGLAEAMAMALADPGREYLHVTEIPEGGTQ